jgi:hypothetical protein
MAFRAPGLLGRLVSQRSVTKTLVPSQRFFQNVRSNKLHSLPPLDYDWRRGLPPGFSARSMSIHYQGVLGSHVVRLNKLVAGNFKSNPHL